jgi:YidC/Oxa1 family membrane protein insertase
LLLNDVIHFPQAPLFISFFMGLRSMANVPVESMRTGGLFWFSDLTVPDQYYLMPIITSVTMWVTIEVGTDSVKLSSGNLQTMKYILRAMPICILPFTVNFPGVSEAL